MSAQVELSDEEIEQLIDVEAMLLLTAKTPEERRAAMSMLTKLHALSSPHKVLELEVAQGLR